MRFHHGSKLRVLEFDIICIRKIDHGQQIRLGCGAVINAYENGTVLVQGKLYEHYRERSSIVLRHILPLHTRWCVK